jgi:hypothetical protein
MQKADRVVLPEGLVSIGTGAFKGCSSLLDCITIPSTVNNLGMHALLMCGKHQEVIIHDRMHHGL